MKRIAYKLAKYGVVLVYLIWIIGFLTPFICGILSHIGVRMQSSKIRLPLGNPGGIAVDSIGRIYCTANIYSRLQVYDNEGQFLQGWFVPISPSAADVQVDANDHIHVGTSNYDIGRNEREYAVFAASGKLLGKVMKPLESSSVFGQTKGADGNLYKTENYWLFPRIIKITPTGEQTVIIFDPLYLSFIKAPIPSFAGVFGMAFVYGIWKLWKKKTKENVTAEATP